MSKGELFRIWFERPLPKAYQPLLEGFAVAIGPTSVEAENPFASLPGAHAIIAGSRIRYDGKLMDQAPTLRVISRTGIGIDNIVLADATARGIAICNTPDAPTVSTAEHAVTLLLAVTKHLRRSQMMLLDGKKHDFFSEQNGLELNGAQLGLVGMGRIGSRVAKAAQALGMKVAVYDPFLPPERADEMGVTLVSALESLLGMADVLSIHAPLTDETRKLINADRLAQLKPGAYLINTSRGPLIDEPALIAALERGHLRGVALDVFDPEPPDPNNPLLHRDDVIATPHIAGATVAGKDRLWRNGIMNALQVLRGERPVGLCNPEVWVTVQQNSL
jgi:D-3-phosphoglycerate dehydrogenase / 2-oxoglutarate reductase